MNTLGAELLFGVCIGYGSVLNQYYCVLLLESCSTFSLPICVGVLVADNLSEGIYLSNYFH